LRRTVPVALALAAALVACGPSPGAASAPASVAFSVLDPAPWESGWDKTELDTWREGVLMELEPGLDGKPREIGPVAGATVELVAPTPEGAGFAPDPVATAVTAADGTFRVGPGPAPTWILRIRKEGYATAWVGAGAGAAMNGAVAPLAGAPLKVALRAAHVLRGTVVDDGGRPVVRAHVAVSSIAYREDLTTDAGGHFTAHAPFGAAVVELDPGIFDAKPVTVAVAAFGDPQPVTVVARPAASVRGWVQSSGGARLADAVVLCAEDPSLRTRSGPDGTFELRAPRGTHLAALTGGYGWRSNAIPRAGEMEMRLPPGPGLSGVVVDRDGRPVADARLTAVVVNYEGLYERVLGPRTGPDGSFRFTWLPPQPRGVPGSARVLARRRGFGESAIVAAGETADGARLTLRGVGDLSGRAARADGTPVAGALVEAKWGHWDGGITPQEVATFGVDESASATTGADGRWRLPGVPLGLHAKVRCSALGVTKERFVDEAAVSAPMDFVFAPGVAIEGRVVAAGGAAPEGAVRVTAQLLNAPGTEVSRSVAAGADGSFRFDDLPEGSYQLRAEGDRYDLGGGKVVSTGQGAAVVPIERSAAVTVKLAFEGGAAPDVPLVLTLVPIEGGSQQFRRVIPAGRGAEPVELRGLYPGAWNVAVAGDVWRGSAEGVQLDDGSSRVLEVAVKRTLRVAAKLLDPGGRPLARQLVVFVPAGASASPAQSVLSADDGGVDLTGLSPGRWVATAEPPKAAPLRAEFDVTEGVNAPLELRLPPSGTIVVRVAKDDGDPIAGAVAVLTRQGGAVDAWDDAAPHGRTNRFRTDARGIATIVGVPVGRVHVDVRADPSLLKSADVDVGAGRTVTVEVP
jgi:hypothetical protein